MLAYKPWRCVASKRKALSSLVTGFHDTMRLRACSANAQLCTSTTSGIGVSNGLMVSDQTASLITAAENGGATARTPAEKTSGKHRFDACYAVCTTMLRGAWKHLDRSAFRFEQLVGGLSNELYLCGLPDGVPKLQGEPQQVVVRFFSEILKRNVHNLVLGSVVFALLSERNFGPKLHGVFPGGRIEEYIPSRSLRTEELWLPAISGQVAEKLAAIHELDMPLEKSPCFVFSTMRKWLRTIKQDKLEIPEIECVPPSLSAAFSELAIAQNSKSSSVGNCVLTEQHNASTKFNIEAEYEWLKHSLESRAASFPVVFCHNDLQEGNILLLEDSCHPDGFRLLPIDFEYCSYNYRAFDFGNHFCEWMYDYTASEAPYFTYRSDKYPTRDQQKLFFERYLAAQSRSSVTLTSESLRTLEIEAAYGALMSHLYWSLWSIVQHKLSDLRFGYLSYARDRLRDYVRMKHCLLAFEADFGTAGCSRS